MAKKSQKSVGSAPAARAASSAPAPQLVPVKNPYLTASLALLVPGAGHFYLGDRQRALLLGAIVLLCLILGCSLDGLLMWQTSGSPLLILGTIGSAGAGLPFFFLHFGLGYAGDPTAAGYEYGASFLLTAGLLNWLLALDAWDRAWGRTVSLVDGSLVDGAAESGGEDRAEGKA